MIVSTTSVLEGKEIIEYKGIVFGEVISGVNFFRDIMASVRNIVGGRSAAFEKELFAARENALDEMCKHAEEKGCNAVVGVKFDYESFGSDGLMLMVNVTGTAVVYRDKQ